MDFAERAFAHRACAAQLWLLCEKYRALLAEVHDGLVELPEITARRDKLMREVQNVYEHALPADREAFQIAREALGAGTGAPSDQDIDQFLTGLTPPDRRSLSDINVRPVIVLPPIDVVLLGLTERHGRPVAQIGRPSIRSRGVHT